MVSEHSLSGYGKAIAFDHPNVTTPVFTVYFGKAMEDSLRILLNLSI